MPRLALAALFIIVSGCGASPPRPRSSLDQQLFGASSIRLHPTFTLVRNWSGGAKPDGIEAALEVDDQFGDPTRSTGKVIFDLYAYRNDRPEVRGPRLAGPWVAFLNTPEQQQAHWNSALRAYTFQLHFPLIAADRYYVLTAQLDLNGEGPTTQPTTESATSQPAGRLFSRLIIEPQNEEKQRGHQHAPVSTPGR
jgi:hypothetical protein